MKLDLVSRQSVLNANPVLARASHDWQWQSFDPEADPWYAGQEVWDGDLEEIVVLSEADAAEMNARDAARFAGLRDEFDTVPPALPPGAFCVAELECATFEAFAAAIAEPTRALFDHLGWSRILMIGSSRIPYLEQANDTAPVAAAEDRLLQAGLTRTYDGGLAAGAPDAAAFLADYFWIARCNANAPYLYVTAPGASTLLLPCKYGNYHVETFPAADAARVESGLQAAGFVLAPDGICEERFSDDGAIPGRKLSL